MRCQIVKFSPAPNKMSVQSRELKLFQIDRLTRLYGTQTLLRRRKILENKQNLIRSPCITSVCKKKVRTTFSKRGLVEESKLFQNHMMHLNQ
jgi:hypothetical protein